MPARSEPTPLASPLLRYAPRRAFPRYRFVPGLNPHPIAHPDGHSRRDGAPEPPPRRLPPDRWREDEEWLFGCDLYNHAYWWEAHEAWEGLWHQTDKRAPEGLFLQGLIQVSASHLKRHMGEPEGSAKLARLGLEKLRAVERAAGSDGLWMGLDVTAFANAAESYAVDGEPGAPWPTIVLAR